MPDYKTPGVYIEELPATGPIAGVGTSTPVFIGRAQSGPTLEPTKVTNWTQFKAIFGDYLVAPRAYLAYAVRAFFENGGTVAYIVRVGTAMRAARNIPDRGTAGGFSLYAEAVADGPGGNAITVVVADAQIVAPVEVLKPRVSVASNTPKDVITVNSATDAQKFSPGDQITMDDTAAHPTELATIDRIVDAQIFLTTPLLGTYTTSSFVRIADLRNRSTFRVKDATGLEAGSAVRIANGVSGAANVVEEFVVVRSVVADVVTLDQPITQDLKLGATDAAVKVESNEFDLTVTQPGHADAGFPKLAMDPRHSRYWRRLVVSPAVTVSAPTTPSVERPPKNRPATGTWSLQGGNADTTTPSPQLFRDALDALEPVDDINLVCMPDNRNTDVQAAVVTHCETMGDRFAILDSELNEQAFTPLVGSVLAHRRALSSQNGYAGLYYPWLQIVDPAGPTGADVILVPPSGAVAGIYARSDAILGVHKAPANEEVRGAIGLEQVLSDADQGELNVEGVNVIRMFQGIGRPVVWGARTIAPADQTAWRYINVRRLFLYVEESLQEGLRPYVFDPNDLGLWKRLDRTVSEFLTRVWRSGALFGATASDAFYVKIDEENNPESIRELGQVIIEIGLAPVRPAEFIVVRIGMWAGKSDVTEQ